MRATLGERQYLPAPVSTKHASFGSRCEKCHALARDVANAACLECHSPRLHSRFEVDTPACSSCHVEHREAKVFRWVSNQACVSCHEQAPLRTVASHAPLIQPQIGSFKSHPQFAALRDGRQDGAALRFNHATHLTSDKIAAQDKLSCSSCHQTDARGAYMRPVTFVDHCRRCHEQKPPNPLGQIEAPHKTPDEVRSGVAGQLLAIAVDDPDAIFKGRTSTFPGVADRAAISEARTLQAYREEWLQKIEGVLFKPLDDTTPLLENNKYCFLCHVQDGPNEPGQLPKIKATAIAKRWLTRGEFPHRRHELIACAGCHPDIEKSKNTADVNLPPRETCERCHVDGSIQSAGTECMLCHLYHDTSRDPEARARSLKPMAIDALLSR